MIMMMMMIIMMMIIDNDDYHYAYDYVEKDSELLSLGHLCNTSLSTSMENKSSKLSYSPPALSDLAGQLQGAKHPLHCSGQSIIQ